MPNADFNVRFNYNDQFQIGVGFNTNKSVSLEAAYTLGAGDNYDFAGLWRIGYSYNLSFSPIANYSGNTHYSSWVYSGQPNLYYWRYFAECESECLHLSQHLNGKSDS